MIDYEQQEHDRIETPNLVPIDDTLLFGRNAGTLEEIRDLLRLIYSATIRQESPAPSMVFIGTTPSRNDTPLSVRFRVQYFVCASSAAGNVTLKLGTMTEMKIDFGAADTKVIPYPRTIDAGVDVTFVAAGGASVDAAYLVGYAEDQISHA